MAWEDGHEAKIEKGSLERGLDIYDVERVVMAVNLRWDGARFLVPN